MGTYSGWQLFRLRFSGMLGIGGLTVSAGRMLRSCSRLNTLNSGGGYREREGERDHIQGAHLPH